MSVTISHSKLSSEEAKILRHRLWAVGLFAVISSIFFYVFFFQVKLSFSGGALYPLIGFALFFSGIIVYMVLGVTRDLLRGEKQLIKGVVTDKHRHKSSNTGSRGKGGSSSRPKYYLHFGDEKFYVEYKHYHEVSVGDTIELHYAPHSKVSLKVVRLSETAEIRPVKEKQSIREQLFEWDQQQKNLPRKELAMSEADRKLLRQYRNRTMTFNLSFAGIGLFMLLAFAIGTLLWWVMVFPSTFLFFWVVFFSRRVIKTHKLYRRDADSGLKIAVKTKILDKQMHTGSSRNYLIRTSLGQHSVKRHVYELVQVREDAIVFLGKDTGWLIDIQTKSLSDSK